MENHMKRYFIEFGSAMSLYAVVLISVIHWRDSLPNIAQLLPAVPLLLAFWAIIRMYHRMDEFYQRVHSEAFALGALVTGVAVMIWGFAENAGVPALPTIFIGPAMIALWGLCLPIIIKRY